MRSLPARPAPVEQLPNTGVGMAREKFLSPVFIAGDDYGTRASTLLTGRASAACGAAPAALSSVRPRGARKCIRLPLRHLATVQRCIVQGGLSMRRTGD